MYIDRIVLVLFLTLVLAYLWMPRVFSLAS